MDLPKFMANTWRGVASPNETFMQIVEPRAAMPSFYPNTLTDVDVRDVVAYVLTL